MLGTPPPLASRPLVVDIDGSVAGCSAISWACAEAERRGVPLQLIYTYSSRVLVPGISRCGVPAPILVDAASRDHAAEIVAETDQWARAAYPSLDLHVHAVEGDPVGSLLALARQADSLVIGAGHSDPVETFTRGCRVQELVDRSPGPVVVVPTEPNACASRAPVVARITADQSAFPVLAYASQHARRHNTGLYAVLCWRPSGRTSHGLRTKHDADLWLFDTLAMWRQSFPDLHCTGTVIANHHTAALLTESADANLLVIGKRPRPPWSRPLVPPVARRLLRHARPAVAAVPAALSTEGSTNGSWPAWPHR